MSYMNDDTDPFGVPYGGTNVSFKEKEENPIITTTLKEYRELIDQKEDYKQTLQYLENDIEKAEEELSEKIKQILAPYVGNIDFERNRVIVNVYSISYSKLTELKRKLHLKDIGIGYEDNIHKLYLKW